jgi:hypothetical protein
MKPNYLQKEELQYEHFDLGLNSDSDFQTSLKFFRSVVTEKLLVDLRNLSTQSVEELYECVVNKSLQMQALITQQKSELAVLKTRFRTRLSHLRGRLLHLPQLVPSALGIRTSKYQQARNRLDSIETNVAKKNVADRPRQRKEEDDTNNTMPEDVSAQDNTSPDKRQDRQDTGSLSIVTGPVHMEVGTLVDQIAQVNAGMVVAQVTPSGQGLSMCLPHILIIVFPTI